MYFRDFCKSKFRDFLLEMFLSRSENVRKIINIIIARRVERMKINVLSVVEGNPWEVKDGRKKEKKLLFSPC